MSTAARLPAAAFAVIVITCTFVGLVLSVASGMDLAAASDLLLRVAVPGVLATAAARLLGVQATSQLVWVGLSAAGAGMLVLVVQLVWLVSHFPFS